MLSAGITQDSAEILSVTAATFKEYYCIVYDIAHKISALKPDRLRKELTESILLILWTQVGRNIEEAFDRQPNPEDARYPAISLRLQPLVSFPIFDLNATIRRSLVPHEIFAVNNSRAQQRCLLL